MQTKLSAQHYEHSQPWEMIHLGIKRLGRIDGVGHRSQNQRGAGWELLHACVDDHSRVAYTKLLADEKATTCTDFLLRAKVWVIMGMALS